MSMMRTFATVAFIVAAFSISQSSYAQTTTNAENPCGCVWRDAKTGEPVASGPILPAGTTIMTNQPVDRAVRPTLGADTAFDPESGRNFARDANCVWRDVATGEPVASGPILPAGTTIMTNQPVDRAVRPTLGADTVFDPESGRNFVLVPCPPPTQTTTPPPATTGTTPEQNKRVALQLRGFGGATIVNGNSPSTAGFDGAVLFPLGNRVLVGPTAGFQWVNSSIINSFGSMTVGSTFGNDGVGFKEGNFGGQIGLNLSGWELGIRGGATVAGSTITQAEGFCGPTAGCTISSTTTAHDTVVGPFMGGYISHSIFSHVGVFVEYDYHRLKDTKSGGTGSSGGSQTVFDLHENSVVGGIVLSFGRHK